MANTSLADLDELVLLCRDERARLYIIESVGCYRAGAYRSSIVAAWIAVCYDIIDKLRELALAGDKEAERLVEEIERTRRANDITRALKFERELLELARDKFELISHLEYIDLERLQQDRNRCAHPSLISEDQGFNPSGELARLHIHSTVTHLLQHPPVQGKYALERLLREVASDYFPDDTSKATTSLASGPLKRPRESLVRNFTLVLLKQALDVGVEWKAQLRVFAALSAVRSLHAGVFEATIHEKLTPLFRHLNDKELHLAILLLRRVTDIWRHLAPDVHHRIENFVEGLPADNIHELEFLLEYPPLQIHASSRLAKTTKQELKGAMFFTLPKQAAERYIDIYLSSKNYAEANEWGKHLSLVALDFSALQQRRLIAGIPTNDQVLHSVEVGNVISRFRQAKKLEIAEFETLLNEHGLEKYLL